MNGVHLQASDGFTAERLFENEKNRPAASQSDRNLNELRALNRHYIELLAKHSMLRFCLPDGAAKNLPALSAPAMDFAARCPFALFDCAFSDAERWHAFGDETTSDQMDACETTRDFAKAGLFFAWHLLNGNESGHIHARLLLGVHPRTAAAIRALPLPRLLDVADQANRFLAPRWSNHALFWPQLLESAQEGQPARLQAIRTLGRQLLAADALRSAASKAAGDQRSRPG